jgi:hypothetical protein
MIIQRRALDESAVDREVDATIKELPREGRAGLRPEDSVGLPLEALFAVRAALFGPIVVAQGPRQ